MSKQSFINSYKLLSLLKKNTDKNHPINQIGLRKLIGEEKAKIILGDKGTFNRRLTDLADAFNTDEDGNVLKEAEWKIVYPGYNKDGKNGKIYFNQPVNDFEVSFLLKKIDESIEFTDIEKSDLKRRLQDALVSKYYDENAIESQALILDLDNKEILDEKLSDNIKIIRDNIINMRMLEITFEDSDTDLRITPYRIIHKDGYYWMLGNRHAIPRDDRPWDRYTDDLSVYRIDLMKQIKTAHTPDETYIHWTMTTYLMPDQSYHRDGAGRETKARYNEYVNRNLAKLKECNYDVDFEHGKVININQ